MSNNWKMRCVNTFEHALTQEKIYDVINGRFTYDNGQESSIYNSFEDFVQQNPNVSKDFELVEEPKQALEVECYNIENVVLFKVLHQDDSKIERGNFKFISSNGLEIDSENIPICYCDGINIKGLKKSFDNRLESYTRSTIEEAEEYVAKVHEAVKELNESLADKPKGRWKPENGEKYWCVDSRNHVDTYFYKSDVFDNKKWNENDIFQTKEEAERKKEIFNKLYELRHEFSLEEWKNESIYKYYIGYVPTNYTSTNKCSYTTYAIHDISSNYHFETESDAQEFFDFCGADDYMRYVLGVY